MDYHFVHQPGPDPALVLLHGFTGSSASWLILLARLAGQRDIIAIDLLGHGQTSRPRSPQRYRIEHAARDIAVILDHLCAAPVHLLGYSMGGRLALFFARHYPAHLRSLILESSSPGIANSAERAQRRRNDEALAASIESEGIRRFVAYWESLPLFASQTRVSPQRLAELQRQRLRNDVVGLANTLRGMGTGRQPSLWNELSLITLPVLLVCGELDSKFVEIGKRMAERLPNAEVAIVPRAGHAVHFERPSAYTAVVGGYVRRIEP